MGWGWHLARWSGGLSIGWRSFGFLSFSYVAVWHVCGFCLPLARDCFLSLVAIY